MGWRGVSTSQEWGLGIAWGEVSYKPRGGGREGVGGGSPISTIQYLINCLGVRFNIFNIFHKFFKIFEVMTPPTNIGGCFFRKTKAPDKHPRQHTENFRRSPVPNAEENKNK